MSSVTQAFNLRNMSDKRHFWQSEWNRELDYAEDRKPAFCKVDGKVYRYDVAGHNVNDYNSLSDRVYIGYGERYHPTEEEYHSQVFYNMVHENGQGLTA